MPALQVIASWKGLIKQHLACLIVDAHNLHNRPTVRQQVMDRASCEAFVCSRKKARSCRLRGQRTRPLKPRGGPWLEDDRLTTQSPISKGPSVIAADTLLTTCKPHPPVSMHNIAHLVFRGKVCNNFQIQGSCGIRPAQICCAQNTAREKGEQSKDCSLPGRAAATAQETRSPDARAAAGAPAMAPAPSALS